VQSAGGVKVEVRGFRGKDVMTGAAEVEALLDAAPDPSAFDMIMGNRAGNLQIVPKSTRAMKEGKKKVFTKSRRLKTKEITINK
jgi:hypothetical protein